MRSCFGQNVALQQFLNRQTEKCETGSAYGQRQYVPPFMGHAARHKGFQQLLDEHKRRPVRDIFFERKPET